MITDKKKKKKPFVLEYLVCGHAIDLVLNSGSNFADIIWIMIRKEFLQLFNPAYTCEQIISENNLDA